MECRRSSTLIIPALYCAIVESCCPLFSCRTDGRATAAFRGSSGTAFLLVFGPVRPGRSDSRTFELSDSSRESTSRSSPVPLSHSRLPSSQTLPTVQRVQALSFAHLFDNSLSVALCFPLCSLLIYMTLMTLIYLTNFD